MNMREKIKSTMRGELEQVVVQVAKFEDEYWLCINPEEVIDAILDAMRKPNQGMIESAAAQYGLNDDETVGERVATIHIAMIDAIKAGK